MASRPIFAAWPVTQFQHLHWAQSDALLTLNPLLRLKSRPSSVSLPHRLSSLTLPAWLQVPSWVPSLHHLSGCKLSPDSCPPPAPGPTLFISGQSPRLLRLWWFPICRACCFLFQCPDSNLVICCLDDCDKPVTLATLPCLRLQCSLPETQDRNPAEGEQSLLLLFILCVTLGEINLTGSQLSLCESSWVTEFTAHGSVDKWCTRCA